MAKLLGKSSLVTKEPTRRSIASGSSSPSSRDCPSAPYFLVEICLACRGINCSGGSHSLRRAPRSLQLATDQQQSRYAMYQLRDAPLPKARPHCDAPRPPSNNMGAKAPPNVAALPGLQENMTQSSAGRAFRTNRVFFHSLNDGLSSSLAESLQSQAIKHQQFIVSPYVTGDQH